MAGSETVYGIHHFDAENDDEISFSVGEPLIVIQRDDGYDDGWWHGRNALGQIGLFPVNYTSPIPLINTPINTPINTHADTTIHTTTTTTPNTTPPVTTHQPSLRNTQKTFSDSMAHPAIANTNPEDWSVDQVGIWLEAMQFGQVVHIFKAQEISGDILLELTIESLKELDINTFGKRFKIHSAINALREERSRQEGGGDTDSGRTSIGYSRPEMMESGVSQSDFEPRRLATSSSFQPPSKNTNSITSITTTDHPSILPVDSRSSMDSINQRTRYSDGSVAPDMEGWLHKQSDKYRTWNKRWFVLKGYNLFYFKSPTDVRMKGIINLRGYKIILDENIHAGKYSFKAQHDTERTFYFHTDTENSMRAWLKTLIKATISRDYKAPVMSSSTIPTVSLDTARRMKPRPPSVLLYAKENPPPIPMQTIPHSPTDSSIPPMTPQYRPGGLRRLTEESQTNVSLMMPKDHEDWNSADYIDWVNQIIYHKLNDLTEFRTGDMLIELLESLSGKEVERLPTGDKIVAAFKFMSREGVDIEGRFTIKDIFGGNEQKIVDMLSAIKTWVDSYQIVSAKKASGGTFGAKNDRDDLRAWDDDINF
ncbi:hypothetical protein J3Q64DRAFT_1632272 [Phycomyces blakesleeanus]|uniref:Polar growth protein n=1 Tax=Phycomyces blakesleeanus TaxID=4837 RepID=A0ABR3BJ14_PHYBL